VPPPFCSSRFTFQELIISKEEAYFHFSDKKQAPKTKGTVPMLINFHAMEIGAVPFTAIEKKKRKGQPL
jgi:hypothetical protein